MNEQVSSYLTTIEGLEDVHRRLQSVVILNDDACRVIEQQDGRNTLFYCDPPYQHETRVSKVAYAYEMDNSEHERLLQTLERIEGKFLLSGYRSTLYDKYADRLGWRREDRVIDNKASSKKSKEKKCECLWLNFTKDEPSTPPQQQNSAAPNPAEADSTTEEDSEGGTQTVLFDKSGGDRPGYSALQL